MVTKETVTYKSLPSSVAISLSLSKKTSLPCTPCLLLLLSHWAYTLGLRGQMHSVNKGATYRCKSLQILNTVAAVKVVTEQQLCVSLVAPRPAP